ncbi:uncharacterized protein VTP21DRAFT_11433 [Calcarisporiella thermophila]|uniref:uncharacterized protein n=1 Tax=Calcarisporiella thermophila TaxID=911321 RepID=UPI00374375A2
MWENLNWTVVISTLGVVALASSYFLSKPTSSSAPSPGSPTVDPPKDQEFTPSELSKYNGTDKSLPIYVAIKGTVFDVSKSGSYGPGGSYHCFAGRDASRALGMSSLKPEDCVADYSNLDEKQLKVLDDWYKFFAKRYSVVGKVVN